jgi:hypothetical protein
MNLVTKSNNDYIEPIPHDNNINSIISDFNVKEEKVVVFDADSLPFICSYQPKNDEFGNPTEYYTKKNGGFDIAEGILNEKLLGIFNKIEEYFTIKTIYLCVKGNNNPRKQWLSSYKTHRPETPEIVNYLHNILIEKHNAFIAPIGEADDAIKTLVDTLRDNALICGIDKDLLTISGYHYNYSKDFYQYIDEKTANYNFWTQVLIGDSTDFENLSPKIGKKYAEKVLDIDMTEEEYKEAVYNGFLKAWKGNVDLAKEKMELSYKLVKLWNFKELENVENK